MKIENINSRVKLLLINMFLVVVLIIIFMATSTNIAKKNIIKVANKVELEIENTLTQKLEKATQIAVNVLEEEEAILQRKAVFLVNNRKIKNILNYELVEKISIEKRDNFNNEYIQRYKKAKDIDYLKLIIELKKNMFGLEESSENIQIVDEKGIVKATTMGLAKQYQKKSNSQIIKYMFETKSESFATILSTKYGLILKAYGSYLNKFGSSEGLVIVAQPIDMNFANKLKKITDTEIIIYNKSENIASTFSEFENEIKMLKLDEEKGIFDKLKKGNPSIIKDEIVEFGMINGKKIEKKYKFVFKPIVNYKNEVIGMIAAGLSKEKQYELLDEFDKTKKEISKELIKKLLEISFLVLVFATIIIAEYSKIIVAPLKNVLKIVKDVSIGKLENKVEIKSKDEIGRLGEGINNMIEGLKEMENLKKTQNEIVQAKKMASLGEVVAGVAHEINTPLGIKITSATYISHQLKEFREKYNQSKMTKKDLELFLDEIEKAIDLINSNLKKTVRLVNKFKKIAITEEKEEKKIFDLKELIDTIVLSLNLKNKEYTILINCPDEMEIKSYSTVFLEILVELVKNTELHGFVGNEYEKIEIEIVKEKNNIILIYKENGEGISEENLKKIYEPFFTTKRGSEFHSGLGFHMIYNLVRYKLKGDIKVESKKGEGIKVIITTPL